jgi:hypothetical protein
MLCLGLGNVEAQAHLVSTSSAGGRQNGPIEASL